MRQKTKENERHNNSAGKGNGSDGRLTGTTRDSDRENPKPVCEIHLGTKALGGGRDKQGECGEQGVNMLPRERWSKKRQ